MISAAAVASTGGADTFEVWPENWRALLLFVDLETSWTILAPAFGRVTRIGLPATEIHAALQMHGVSSQEGADLYRDLRTMERAAIEAIAAT